jgi:hypothetical protein
MEVAPTYFHRPEVPDRVMLTLGDTPVVVTLRDPIKRSFSLYLHLRRYGMTRANEFRDALLSHPELVDSSRYATHLSRWIDIFGKERVQVIMQENLEQECDSYVRRLTDHVGLGFIPVPERLKQRVNAAVLPASRLLASAGQWSADRLREAGLYGAIELAKRVGLKRLFFGKPGASDRLPTLKPEDRRWLLERLAPEIDRLEEILELDLSAWKIP